MKWPISAIYCHKCLPNQHHYHQVSPLDKPARLRFHFQRFHTRSRGVAGCHKQARTRSRLSICQSRPKYITSTVSLNLVHILTCSLLELLCALLAVSLEKSIVASPVKLEYLPAKAIMIKKR